MKYEMNKIICGLFTVVMLGGAMTAQASVLYANEFAGVTPLYTVDQSVGTIASIGSTGLDGIGDMTSDTRAGTFTLWGVQISSNTLYTFDSATGASTGNVAMNSTDNMVSLAFDPVSGILYGNTSVAYGAPFDALYSIDPLTGNTTFIGRILFDNVFALGFDQSGQLFGISDNTKQLISISTLTGNGSLIANLGLNGLFDMASRPEDGVMFVADSGTVGTNSLYTINTTTGATALVGSFGPTTNIVGLAYGPTTVPEPTTLALMGLGLADLRFNRKRKTIS